MLISTPIPLEILVNLHGEKFHVSYLNFTKPEHTFVLGTPNNKKILICKASLYPLAYVS